MANNYISWVNDIYGVDKERVEGTTANLVLVLRHEQALSWDDAIERAIEQCNAELRAFRSLERGSRSSGSRARASSWRTCTRSRAGCAGTSTGTARPRATAMARPRFAP